MKGEILLIRLILMKDFYATEGTKSVTRFKANFDENVRI